MSCGSSSSEQRKSSIVTDDLITEVQILRQQVIELTVTVVLLLFTGDIGVDSGRCGSGIKDDSVVLIGAKWWL